MRIQALSVVLLLAIANIACAEDTHLLIGQKIFNVAIPEGMFAVGDRYPQERKQGEMAVKQDSTLIDIFLPKSVESAIAAGKQPNAERYVLLETKTASIGHAATQQDISVLSQQLKQNGAMSGALNGAMNIANIEILRKRQEQINRGAPINITDIVPLGVFLDEPNAVGYAAVAAVQGQDAIVQRISTIAVTIPRGQVIEVLVYAQYHSADDVRWAEQTAISLVHSIWLENNASQDSSNSIPTRVGSSASSLRPFEDPEPQRQKNVQVTSPSAFDTNKMITDAIAGALIGLFYFGVQKFRRKQTKDRN